MTEVEARLADLLVTRQPDWAIEFRGLAQGLTVRSDDFSFEPPSRSSADEPRTSPDLPDRDGWRRLQAATRIEPVARCRQVHGTDVLSLAEPLPPGVHTLGDGDALVTSQNSILLTVTVADCVPVYLVDPDSRTLGLVHAGWRGTAAGIVGAALSRMADLGAGPSRLRAHLGPAICGRCYEVGPEVVRALGLRPVEQRRVDLRGHIARSLQEAGIDATHVTISPQCTRCQPTRFFSYRGGDLGRRMCAFLGWEPG